MTLQETWPWIIPPIAFLIWFTYFEARAFENPKSYWTLSKTVSSVAAKWPLSIGLWCLLIGILLSHFFWPWAENPLGPGGG
jgi:hypothetical protein